MGKDVFSWMLPALTLWEDKNSESIRNPNSIYGIGADLGFSEKQI